jgi:hypothetical protein
VVFPSSIKSSPLSLRPCTVAELHLPPYPQNNKNIIMCCQYIYIYIYIYSRIITLEWKVNEQQAAPLTLFEWQNQSS